MTQVNVNRLLPLAISGQKYSYLFPLCFILMNVLWWNRGVSLILFVRVRMVIRPERTASPCGTSPIPLTAHWKRTSSTTVSIIKHNSDQWQIIRRCKSINSQTANCLHDRKLIPKQHFPALSSRVHEPECEWDQPEQPALQGFKP